MTGRLTGSRAGASNPAVSTKGFDPGREKAPYGQMCRNPQLCAGKGYCPRDPTCGD